jgi:hypothetical protein
MRLYCDRGQPGHDDPPDGCHINGYFPDVTEHPCTAWTSQQIVEAFANQDAPQYLLRDRDRIYGNEVRSRISSLQIGVLGRIPTSNA